MVLIYTLVLIELLAFLAYFLATGHGNSKYEIYSQSFFANFIPYDIAKLIFLAGAQFLITVYAFMNWYRESYSVRSGLLSHDWGVFYKKRKEIPLDKSMTVTISFGPLGRLLHYGSIQIENGYSNKSIALKDISRPEHFAKTLKFFINPREEFFHHPPNISEILNEEEHERLEFKSSLRFDHKAGALNRDLERAVMKTIAAFLNTEGGLLVLGIDDKREPLGLEWDYKTLKRPNSDGFENHFTQIFNIMIGPEFRHLVKLWFHNLDEKEVCMVQTIQSAKPVYLRADNKEHFYVRTGNVSTPLKMSEVENYNNSHFQKVMVE